MLYALIATVLDIMGAMKMDKDILRRITERGTSKAEKGCAPPPFPEYEQWHEKVTRGIHESYLDLFVHLLDEIERLP